MDIRTFLIADVRGYTRFTQAHGDEAGAQLAARFAVVVREEIEPRGGTVVELRGDEALCAFGSPRSALRRSRQIVAGNGWNVFKILFACGVLNFLVLIPFTLAAAGTGPFFQWIAATLASALTAPYAAHALTVVYYTLLEPGRPVALEPGRRWESVWTAQDEIDPAPMQATEPNTETLDEEYARKFDERTKQWGG